VDYIRDCRKSPNCTFLLFSHLIKSASYKCWLIVKPKVSGFSDSLYFNLNFPSRDPATIFWVQPKQRAAHLWSGWSRTLPTPLQNVENGYK
jgi:hypothetical protein